LATERFKELAFMIDQAYLRVLVSAAAAYKQGVKFKGVDDSPDLERGDRHAI
jgi:hypothetical protein